MSTESFKVYYIGQRTAEELEDTRSELESVGARLELLPSLKNEDEIVQRAQDADGLIIASAPITRRVLSGLKRCKVVVRTGVGIDTIDVGAASELGIAVVNVPDLWIREVANHALGLLLACNRRVLSLDRGVRRGQWLHRISPPVGSLHGETLGLVGLGRIGRALARRAAALEMELLAFDPYLPESTFREQGATPVSFHDLLGRSDYVSIHCPLTDETHHLVNEDALRRMKPTAYLINTARGPIVDNDALVRALREGWIAGAGLDVLEEEPPPSDSELLSLENLIVTPHVAFYSDAAVRGLPRRCGQEVARVLAGRRPLNLVNGDVAERLGLRPD